MKRPLFTPFCLLFLLVAVLSGCVRKKEKDGAKKGNEASEGVPVEAAAIERGPIEATWKSSTSLEAEEEVRILSRTASRVTELLVEEGSVVEQGALLLRLENDIQKNARDKAQSSHQKGKEEFERQQKLFSEGLVSVEIFNESKYNLRQLELTLEDAEREFSYTEVRAAIGGTVTTRLVKLGDYVTVNQHLFDIIDFNSIVARVYPPEGFLGQITNRQPARIRSASLDNELFPAYVKRIAPVVKGTTGTFKVTLGFDDVKNLRPGMYVDTEIVLATFGDALLIPKRALVYDGDQTFVYRLGTDRNVERLLLNARLSDQLNVTPVSGFSVGDMIIVAGQTGLKDGAKVRLPGDPKPEKQKTDQTASVKSS